MSNNMIRRSNGQFASGDRDNPTEELIDQVGPKLTRTTPRKSAHIASAEKSPLRIVFSGRKEEVHAGPREALTRDCATIYRSALLLNTIIGVCCGISQIAKVLVGAYFLGNIFLQGTVYRLTTVTLHCLFGRGQQFYSRAVAAIFPAELVENSPNLQIILRESAMIAAEVLVDTSFPVSTNNPIVQLVVLGLLLLNSFILARLQTLMVKIARLARDASPDPTLERRHGAIPEPPQLRLQPN